LYIADDCAEIIPAPAKSLESSLGCIRAALMYCGASLIGEARKLACVKLLFWIEYIYEMMGQ
jgi:hypothetical protein